MTAVVGGMAVTVTVTAGGAGAAALAAEYGQFAREVVQP